MFASVIFALCPRGCLLAPSDARAVALAFKQMEPPAPDEPLPSMQVRRPDLAA